MDRGWSQGQFLQLRRGALNDNPLLFNLPTITTSPFFGSRRLSAVWVLCGKEWMLHVATMTSQEVLLWFIFMLPAALTSVFQTVVVVHSCFELILCKVFFFCVSSVLASMHAFFFPFFTC